MNLVGVDLGSSLLNPDSANAKGYWEHAEAVRINDELLAAFGMAWWNLEPLPEGWLDSEPAFRARAAVEALVNRDFHKVPIWGIKDPRLCRLAPLWIATLESLGIEVSAVFVARSPLEVAGSLGRAQGLSEKAGVLLWVQHLVESEQATRGMDRVLIDYGQLLADPVGTVERMGERLGLRWPIDPRQREQALSAFIDTGLRTQRSVAGGASLPPVAHRLATACERLAASSSAADWSALAERSDEALEFLRWLDYRRHAPLPNEVVQDRLRGSETAYVSLYHAGEGEDFSEDRVVRRQMPPGRTQVELPVAAGTGTRYRLDPTTHAGYYVIHSLVLVDSTHELLWDWREVPEQVAMAGIRSVDSPGYPGTTLHLMNADPQIFLLWPEGTVHEGARLLLDIERFDGRLMVREFEALEDERQRLIGTVQSLDVEVGASRVERRARETALTAIQRQLEDLTDAMAPLYQAQARQEAALLTLLKRDLLSRLRRRFARVRIQLVPREALERVDAAGCHSEAIGNDSMFDCLSQDYPLAPGWYMVTLRMQQHPGALGKERLYPDYGPNVPPDLVGTSMPFIEPGKSVHRGLVRFVHPVFGLRFDPATSPGELSVQGLGLRRVSKLRAALELLRTVPARPGSPTRNGPGWRQTLGRFRAGGLSSTADWLYARYGEGNAYDTWRTSYDNSATRDEARARIEAAEWEYQPLVSILVPTYNTDEKWLRRCIESVQEQVYPHWELCIADDASPEPRVMRVLEEYAASDARLRVTRRAANGHISACSNTALSMAQGEYVALLDHDDELHPFALHEVVAALQARREWKLVFTDEDKIDENGHRYDPYMKPDWNYDLLLSQNCISHLGIYQRQLLESIGGFRDGFEGSQDWDLALRCIEQLAPSEIGHVPQVLYHWRAIPGSTSTGVDQKSYARHAALRAIQEHLGRIGSQAIAEEIDDRPGNFHIRYPLPRPLPKISLVIPTRDGLRLLKQCVDSILAKTTYDNYEIVIVDNQSREPETLAYFRDVVADPRIRVLAYDQPFNYSAINNYAVAQSQSELVGLINNDIEVITPDWLQEMAAHAMRPEIGAVGAMLYYPDDTIQHAGVMLGIHGVAAHAYCGQPRGYPGQMGRARLVQGLSAVTAACLLVRRAVFEQVGGFNETLRVAFNDVDLCLRIRRAGYRNLWTPFAELYHHESATRGPEDSPEKKARFAGEVQYMLEAWRDELPCDPAYSPNLSISDAPFALAFPPRLSAWRGRCQAPGDGGSAGA